jgi:hypothetical protein
MSTHFLLIKNNIFFHPTIVSTCTTVRSEVKKNFLLNSFDYLRFYVPLKNFSYGDVTIAGEGLQNLGLRAQGLWAGRDLYRATPAVTRDLSFSGLIQRTTPFSRLLRHMKGCGESILTWILTGVLLNKLTVSRTTPQSYNNHSSAKKIQTWSITTHDRANVEF